MSCEKQGEKSGEGEGLEVFKENSRTVLGCKLVVVGLSLEGAGMHVT